MQNFIRLRDGHESFNSKQHYLIWKFIICAAYLVILGYLKSGRDELVMLLRWGSKEVHTELGSEKNLLENHHLVDQEETRLY